MHARRRHQAALRPAAVNSTEDASADTIESRRQQWPSKEAFDQLSEVKHLDLACHLIINPLTGTGRCFKLYMLPLQLRDVLMLHMLSDYLLLSAIINMNMLHKLTLNGRKNSKQWPKPLDYSR